MAALINRLSRKQQALLPIYRSRWLEIEACCDPVDLEKATRAVHIVYADAGLKPPETILVVDGPLSCALASALRQHLNGHADRSVLGTFVGILGRTHNQMSSFVGSEAWRQVVRGVGNERLLSTAYRVDGAVRQLLSGRARRVDIRALCAGLRQQIGAENVKESVASIAARWRLPREEIRHSAVRAVDNHLAGHFLAPELAKFAYSLEVLGITAAEPLRGLMDLAASCGSWAPYRDAAILQHRPCAFGRDNLGRLHCDGGPALRYRDGLTFWYLHGVEVPQWLAETRDTDINPAQIMPINNAEVRREFVRKVGIDRICHALRAECVDKQGSYELLLLKLRDGHRRPYLKMLNPSIGTWHVEGVDPRCRTVAEALAWRNGTSESPVMLT